MSTGRSGTFTEYSSPVFALSRDSELLDLTLCGGESFSGSGVEQELDPLS